MTIPVKWFHSDMTGAPQLPANDYTINPGLLIQILDACLINGFNTQAVDSLTYDSATGKCTCVVNAGHGFVDHQVVLVDGATDTAYNGEVRVTIVDAQTFEYVPDAAPSSSTASGTITAKAAPLSSWEKAAWSTATQAAYRSVAAGASGFWLQVDDSMDERAKRVKCWEQLTDFDIGTDQFGHANGMSWSFGVYENVRKWAIVGDDRFFYLFTYGIRTNTGKMSGIMGFGDIVSYKPGDTYQCVILSSSGNGYNINDDNNYYEFLRRLGSYDCYIARSHDAITKNLKIYAKCIRDYIANPDPISNDTLIVDVPILVVADSALRGEMPGMRTCLSDLGASDGYKHIVTGLSNSTDTFLVWRSTSGVLSPAFNLTGSWR